MNITLKLKGNVLRMAFLAVLNLAGMNRSDISEECTVQLYWVTVFCRWVMELEGRNVLASLEGCD
jgi:hypothetical protein